MMTLSWGDDLQDELQQVFSGEGPIASPEQVMQTILAAAQRDVEITLAARRQAALTGAMRWPWSQEYRVTFTAAWRDD